MRKIVILLTSIAATLFFCPMGKSEAAEMISKPQVNLSSYSLNNEKVVLGEDNSIHLEFTNQSGKHKVTDVLVSFSSDDNTVVPVYGESNQIYFPVIDAGKTAAVDLPINIVNQENGYAAMSFFIEYCAGGIVMNNDMSYIVIPVDTLEKLSIKNLSVSSAAQVNAKVSLLVNYENTGKTALKNIHMVINGADLPQPIDLVVKDTLAVEESGYFEYYLSFDTVGDKRISLELKYSDEEGNEYAVDCGEHSVQITGLEKTEKEDGSLKENQQKAEPEQTPQAQETQQGETKEDTADRYLLAAVAALILVGIVAAGLVVRRRK